MTKYLLATAAAAFLMTSAAMAETINVPGGDVCGALPNAKWSWSISAGDPILGDPTINGDVSYNHQGNVGSADVTQTSTAVTNCTAINPAGVPNADHSTTVTGATTTVDLGTQNVCNPSGTLIGGTCPVQ